MDDLTCLRLFASLRDHESFAAAGRAIGVSRAQVSRAVRQLEARLGNRLVHRNTRAMTLTTLGHQYAEDLGAVLRALETAEDRALAKPGAIRGTVRIACARTLGEQHVMPLLAPLCVEHPGLRIAMRLSDAPVRLVEQGFDLAIRVAHPEVSGRIARKLADARALLCAAPEYLARVGRPEHPSELVDHRCVVDTNYAMGSRWSFVDHPVVAVTAAVSADSPEAVRTCLLHGVGVGLTNTVHVATDLAEGRLVEVLADWPLDVRSGLVAVYPSRRHLMPALRLVLDHLADRLAARLGP